MGKITDMKSLQGLMKTVYGNELEKTESGARKPKLDKLKKLLNRQLGRNAHGS